jgi:hypothetical protein
MRFQGLLKSNQPATTGCSSRLNLLEKVGRLMEEASRSGGLAAAEDADLTFARVKLSAGEFTVSGEPRAEAKAEGISYAMFDVDSIVEAILWTKCFLQVLGEGECEIHPLCAA